MNSSGSTKIDKIYPLSPMQENFLFAALLDKDSRAYHQQIVFEAKGTLNLSVFERSIQELINRYDILRSIFIYENIKKPVQVVLQSRKIKRHFEDISDFTTEEIHKKIQEFKEKDLETGFDLTKDLLLRIALFKTAADTYTIFWTYHHILLDGWCRQEILKDFFEIYARLLKKPEFDFINSSKIPYKPFIDWLDSKDKDIAREYWKNLLNNYDNPASLPKISQELSGYSLREEDLLLDEKLSKKIKLLAKENQTTVSTVFQAVWALLLMSYTQKDEVVFGEVLSLQNPDIEKVAGLLINTVPVCIQSEEQTESFTNFLAKIHLQKIERQDFTHLSLAEIQSESPLKNRLFDHILIFENYPLENSLSDENFFGETGLQIQFESNYEHSDYPLNVLIIPQKDLFCIRFAYNSVLFEDKLIRQVSRHFKNLLSQVGEESEKPIQEYGLFDEKEIAEIHQIFNLTQLKSYPNFDFLEEIFSYDSQTALIFKNQKISFSTLREETVAFADFLKTEYQIKEGDAVGVLLPRSEKIVVAMLSIFSLGAIYVPIDASYPQERINFIIQDSQIKCLIREDIWKSFNQFIDTGSKIPPSRGDQGGLRIYTSGTSGKPKGTDLSYQNLNSFIATSQEFIDWSEDDQILFLASAAFDISLFEILVPLSQGLAVCISENDRHFDLQYLCDLLNQISVFHAVPALLNQLVRFLDKPLCHINKVFTGGDKVPLDLTEKLEKAFPNAEIYIFYGPSETTILASYYRHQRGTILQNHLIGKPLPHTYLLLSDKYGHYLPALVTGELQIGGYGLGKGYFNQPELTKERFIPPLWGLGGLAGAEVVYLSGDLARYNFEGNFEFLGRRDNQVKIRGQRIEIREIEKVLSEINLVTESMIVPLEIAEDEKQLTAFLIVKEICSELVIKSQLREKLPEYMIPAKIFFLEKFPLNENGKIDTKKLVEIALEKKINENTEELTLTKNEQYLVNCWKELLGIEYVSRKSNFFEIGGHSLKAITLISQLRKEISNQIEVKDIFRFPVLADFADWMDNLSGEKEKNISQALEKPNYPISSLQRRLLILEELDQDAQAYYLSFLWKIQGDLDTQRLEKAINQLLEKYAIFRTYFPKINGIWLQQINNHQPIELSPEKTEIENVEKTIRQSIKKFDLQKEVPLLFRLFQLRDNEYILFFHIHHLLTDGTSIQLLIKELFDLYEGNILVENPLQYKDFAFWESKNPPSQQKDLVYWLNEFSGEIPLLHLPTDRSRPLYQNFKGKEWLQETESEFSKQIEIFCRENKITPNLFLFSVFYVFLYKYTQQKDLVVGLPINGRYRADLEKMQGLLVNMLPLRVQIDEKESYGIFLKKMSERYAEALSHQSFSFQHLIEELNPQRQTDRNPLFDVSFVFNDFETTIPQKNTLSIELLPLPRQSSMFDLSLEVSRLDKNFRFRVEYAEALFNQNTVKRILQHYFNLLKNTIQFPEKPIFHLSCLDEPEEKQLLDWGGVNSQWSMVNGQSIADNQLSTIDYRLNLIRLFENTAQKFPEKIALIFGEKTFTYSEIDQKAENLAKYLYHCKNIQEGNVVALSCQRDETIFIGIFALLKIGAVFLNLDSKIPPERKKYILEKADCHLILDNAAIRDNYQNNSLSDFIKAEKPELCYTIFTSGSTGLPKAVQISHQNLLSITFSWQEAYQLENPVVLQLADFSFDVFIGDLCRALFSGGTLVLTDDIQRRIPEEIVEIIENYRISHLETTPVMARLLAEYVRINNKKISDSLQCLIVGSDIWYVNEYKELKKYLSPHTRLINSYGTTETTIDNTFFEGDLSDWEDNAIVPIGKPYSNTQIRVLDADSQPCPIGVWGQIVIGGAGVANAFSAGFYKSGDLARWHFSGILEFKGREDNQLKIRGFRIEVHEIEKQLLQFPAIQNCAVIAYSEKLHSELIAFYTASQVLKEENLRSYCRQFLPEYMLPAYFQFLDKMPLTTSGKIDKKKLEKLPLHLKKADISVQNPLQEKIAAIWTTLLPAKKFGIRDNFFALGGNSLKAVQLVSRLKEALQISVSLRDIFLAPTIEALENILQNREKNAISDKIIAVNPALYHDLSPAQRRMWMLCQFTGDKSVYNLVHAYYLQGNLDREKLKNAFQQIIQRHEILRTNFISREGLPKQVIRENDDFVLEFKDLSKTDKPESEIDELIRREFTYPFDLENDSLIRFSLIHLAEEKYFLIVNVHHIIFDGWSDKILIEELLAIYQNQSLSELNIQYKDYSDWQLNQLHSLQMQEAKLYWLKQLGNIPAALDFPDFSRPIEITHTGKSFILYLNPQITESCKGFAQENELTLFMFLLGLYGLVLSEFSGNEDLLIGTVAAGRNHPQSENLIGLFLNSLVLRCLPEREKSLQNYFREIKNMVLDAFEYQDYPIEELVSELKLPYDLSRNPLFDVALIVQNYESKEIQHEAIKVEPYLFEKTAARLDLTLYAQEIHQQLELRFEYNCDLFKEESIEKFARRLEEIITQIISKPYQKLGELLHQKSYKKSIPLIFETQKTPFVYPKDELEEHLSQIFCEILKTEKISAGESFFEAGGHSLSALQLIHQINQKIGAKISLRNLYENPSILKIKPYVSANPQISNRVLILKKTAQAFPNLFMIPPILGSATVFLRLSDYLEANCYGISYKGLEEDESFENSIEEMAASMCEEVLYFPSEAGKHTLIAYSMGCLIAFEMAKILENKGFKTKLILIDKAVNDNAKAEVQALEELDTYIEGVLKQLHSLDTDLYQSVYIERVKKLYAHNSELVDKYIQEGKIRADILAIEAKDNPAKTEMQHWQNYTNGRFSHIFTAGEHYTLLEKENIAVLGKAIRENLGG